MNLFLRMARLLFAEQTISAVFLPALADFQEELRQTAASRVGQLVTRARWCVGLTALLVITPFSVSIPSIADRAPLKRPANGGWFFMALYASLLAGAWWTVQEFLLAALAAGAVLAWAMRAWNDHHPVSIVIPQRDAGAPIQINLAKIPVTGDVAGLMFAAGTILIVVVGLPGLWWYFGSAALGSLVVAWTRIATDSSTQPLTAQSLWR